MPREKLEPFHKSIIYLIANADAAEMRIYANILHQTQIPSSSNAEILRAWKRRCHEIKCPDHEITKRFTQ